MGVYGTPGFISNNTFVNGINEIYIIRQGSTLTMKLNDVSTIFNNFNYSLNFNAGDNTFIGKAWNNSVNTYFVNNIYSVKVLRNTTDISLLEDYKKPVAPIVKDERGVWILDTATWTSTPAPYASSSMMRYNPTLLTDPVWTVLHSNTFDFSIRTP